MTDIITRIVTSLLVVGSIYPLLLLVHNIVKESILSGKPNAIQCALFITYVTFLVSGWITLFINYKVLFLHYVAGDYINIAIMRNLLKSIGIFFVSWLLFIITKRGGAK